jgi:NTP pyrophosphatase (non-canonical NTP hydrolase)
MLKINELINDAHTTAVEKGWHLAPREFGTLIALIHSEITEVYEAFAFDEDKADECADILIRIFDLAGLYKYDLENAYYYRFGFRTLEEQLESMEKKTNRSLEKFLMDMHRSVSKVLETYREKDDENKEMRIMIGFVQVCLNVCDLAKTYDLDLPAAVYAKLEKNKIRQFKHGGKKI